MLLCCCLDTDLIQLKPQCACDVLPHPVNVRPHLRCLCNDRRINVLDEKSVFRKDFSHALCQLQRIGTFPFRIRIREPLADVSERRRAQKCVHNSMQQNIRIGMSEKPLFIRDFHSADDAFSAFCQLMNVVSGSYPHGHSFSCRYW